MNTKTKIAGAIAAIFAGAIIVGTAQATPVASAEAVVSFENFKISHKDGAQLNALTDFKTLSVNSSQLTAANITGQAGVSMNPSSTVGADILSKSSRGVIDPSILPATPTAASIFNVPALPMVGNFSYSVSNEVGSPISNFNSSAANADLHNASYASLDTLNGTAGTSSSSTLTSTVAFKLATATALTFSFDVGAYVAAFLSLDAAESASAAWSITFTLIKEDDNSFAALFSRGNAISNNRPGSGVSNTGAANSSLTGNLLNLTATSFDTFGVLEDNKNYLLTANISTRTQVERSVPEPETLALLGIGLLGMGFSSRKFKNSAPLATA